MHQKNIEQVSQLSTDLLETFKQQVLLQQQQLLEMEERNHQKILAELKEQMILKVQEKEQQISDLNSQLTQARIKLVQQDSELAQRD